MKKQIIFIAVIAMLSGCVATTPRGVVAMKISDSDAHVCLRKQEVKEGETVVIYRNVCERNTGKPAFSRCELRQQGTGQITDRLNDHYSVVHFDNGVKFNEGDVVEVKKQ